MRPPPPQMRCFITHFRNVHTVAYESRKMADGVAGPRLGFVAETGRFVAMETPWVRFSCLLAFVPYLLLFLFRFSFFSYFFPASRYVYLLCVPSSVQQSLLLSASTYFVVRVLSACVICTLPHLGILMFFIHLVFLFLFRSSYFSGGVFLLLCSRTRYASTWFAYLDFLAFGFLSHCDHIICISLGWRIRKDTGDTADIIG